MSKELVDTLQKMAKEISALKNEVNHLRRLESGGGGGGVTDHGALSGLGDNDHPQYLLTSGKAADADKLDNINSTGFVQTSGIQTIAGLKTFSSIPVLPATNPTNANQAVRKGYADATYLGITAKAADSDKLDGLDSTAFVKQTSAQWTPTLVGWSSTTLVQCSYYKVGKIVFFQAIISGTSNSTSTSFTLPENNTGSEYTGSMGYCVNNGSVLGVAARFSIPQGNNVCNTYTTMASGVWTASGTKRVSVFGWYPGS